VVENSSSAGTASFTDLTLLSNDIPAAAASCDDALRLHIDDDDDDDDTLGQSLIVHHHTRLVRGLDVKTNKRYSIHYSHLETTHRRNP